MASHSEPPAKRRKKGLGPNVIKLPNGKTLSLEGYLKPPVKAANPVESTQPPASAASAASAAAAAAAAAAAPASSSAKPDDAIKRRKKPETGSKDQPRKQHAGPGGKEDALFKARQELPISQYRSQIQSAVRQSDVLVLVGETGSGKSTQVPQFLYHQSWCKRRKVKLPDTDREVSVGGMIAITQPRRVAATTLANRVSREAGTPLGKGRKDGDVGYSVRFDNNVPRGTKIKFLTEGMLLQEFLQDPNLRDYSAIIVDEIHERSLDVDLLVGFLKQMLAGDKAGRGGIPLKVIIMSATADVEGIQDFFRDIYPEGRQQEAVQALRIEGRQYPVQIVYEPEPVPNINDALVETVLKAHTQEQFPGDILGFLLGQEEIESAQKLIEERATSLASNVPKIKVVPLYGQLSNEAQREAFLPVKAPFTRKVVLATNIAETSVTVPGVKYVVDCGKARVKQFRPRLGMESLLGKPISKSSALQRTGRAGREGPGKCFRLYTKEAFDTLKDADLPEILRTDVLGAVLTMKARGIQDVVNFPLMDPPELEAIHKAMLQLHFLGAVDEHGGITPTGEKMARFPVPVPFAAVLLAAAQPEFDCVLEVIDIISCVTCGGDIFIQLQSEEQQEEMEEARKELHRREGDIITILTTMQNYTAENSDRTEWCKKRGIKGREMRQALNIRRQLRGMCLKHKLLAEPAPADPQAFVPISPEAAEKLLKCFLRGFASKTAILQPDATYSTTEGKHTVAVHPSSVLHGKKREAIMFLENVFTRKNYAKKVSAIQAGWILEAYQSKYGSPGEW
ncbi:ATP-dependent RNA helicase-like protein [Hapsidospora chrysogenum ATCC 11550]|uniref:RNA helicase n=1 Tax=Hapsidospora chrysogenum (strain ATCC 11550 / CBS 779.69 / DSM 880 / IAM 14645 / JCM 23072 / IMI 49137) TaxID=857340 RepID=A0A086SVG8_HAPC1|nr:ATP-dependent RNA helicase-like protein [Hapsidospora chrysogenum ATCC 11550]